MPGRAATDDQKQRALAIYVTHGPTEAGRQTGFSKASVCNWARQAGIVTHAPQVARVATELSAARRRLNMAEWREEMTTMLRDISMTAATVELTLLSERPTLDKATAARVRATSDLMLLTGEATQRIGLSTDMTEQHEQVRRLRDELAERRSAKLRAV
jgi:hypothetical protein